MTQTDHSSIPDHAPSRPARLAWLLLILTTLYICYFHNLGAIGFVGPDEPRYAWIARAMVETSDWVTPRLYGKPWFEKPVLYYWGAALSFKLFGVSEVTARLPSAICALLATLGVAWLAWRLYSAETARWVLLLLPTTVGMIGFSHAAATDMPFAAMLTLAMVCASLVLGLLRDSNTPILLHTRWLALLFLGFFLGLAVLAKGPAAIVLAGGTVLLWTIFTKRWRDAFRCLHPIAIASFCLTALPWYILCARRNPEFFRVFIIEHNFKRYLTPEFQHIQPFWFYVPVLLIAFVPWTLLLVWTTAYGLLRSWRLRGLSPMSIFLVSWAVFCPLFFSTSQSKLPGYILPAMPPIALLLACACSHLAPKAETSFRWIRYGFSFIGLPIGVALLGMGYFYAVSSNQGKQMIAAGFTLLLFGLANLLLAERAHLNQTFRQAAPLCVVPVLALVLAFNPLSYPWLTPDPSAKSLALLVDQFESHLPASEFLVLQADRNLKYGLSFYLHRDVHFWDPENPKEGFLLFPSNVDTRSCDSYLKLGFHCSRGPVELDQTGWVAYRIHRPK